MYDADVIGVRWLCMYNLKKLNVRAYVPEKFIYSQFDPQPVRYLYPNVKIKVGVYLYANIERY